MPDFSLERKHPEAFQHWTFKRFNIKYKDLPSAMDKSLQSLDRPSILNKIQEFKDHIDILEPIVERQNKKRYNKWLNKKLAHKK